MIDIVYLMAHEIVKTALLKSSAQPSLSFRLLRKGKERG